MSERPSSRSDGTRFCLKFAAYAVIAFCALRLLGEREISALTEIIARATGAVLGMLTLPVARDAQTLSLHGFAVRVEDQCTALHESGLLAAAILAWPAALVARLAGIAVGLGMLFAVNVLRIASLLAIGAYVPGWFSQAHLYVWQGLLVVTVAAYWLGWIGRAQPRAAH